MTAPRCVCTAAGEGVDCRQGTALGATPWTAASSLSARRLRVRLRLLRRCVRQPWLCSEAPEQGRWGAERGAGMWAEKVWKGKHQQLHEPCGTDSGCAYTLLLAASI